MTLRRTTDDSVMAEINITPFTDVLLVLLIIFMILAALEVPPGFQKQLGPTPRKTVSSASSAPQLQIVISRDGRITVDGSPASRAMLYAKVANVVRARTLHRRTPHISLIADKDAAYDLVIKVLDAARQAGDNDVGFVTY
ncbi:MAG TPA: biopolymer transporter ExbD [Candidatus Eremiobacteraceae bacterium]|nr:biopolymer transporter ExbD [Candidatus Eremiobacteraceae bacterium]